MPIYEAAWEAVGISVTTASSIYMSKSLHHLEGIGDVLLVRRKGTRRLSVRMRPFEPICCLAPPGTPSKSAIAFVVRNRAWIRRKRTKIEEIERQQTVFDERTQFRTRYHALSIFRTSNSRLQATIRDRIISVSVPEQMDTSAGEVQSFIRTVIEKALRKEAKAVLPCRVASLAREHNLFHAGVTLRAQRRRWGSCSAKNRINLNVHLMRLPDHLIDYVILHELAHTVHKNHSNAFWCFLDGLTRGSSRAHDRELRDYSPTIF